MLTLLATIYGRENTLLLVLAMLIDISIANVVIAFTGGISNPFSTILLLFVVVAVLLLNWLPALIILVASILGQIAQLWGHQWLSVADHSGHAMGPEFTAHAQGMVISFVIAAMIIWVSSLWLKQRWQRSQQVAQALRERQLRDEQLLTIGSAAAQLAHDLATPIQTMQLLHEELIEQAPYADWQTLDTELTKIGHSLAQWRQTADDVRSGRRHRLSVEQLSQQIRQLLRVVSPQTLAQWQLDNATLKQSLVCDRTLIPAIANLIINAHEASPERELDVKITTKNNFLYWHITNQTQHVDSLANNLGFSLQKSDKGSGAGAVISHATIERHHGQVSWNWHNGIAITKIRLPLSPANNIG